MENEIIGGIVIGIVCAIFGWGISQLTTSTRLTKTQSDMALFMQQSTTDSQIIHQDLISTRADFTQRVDALVGLVNRVINNSDGLIDIVKVQNALLVQAEKNRDV